MQIGRYPWQPLKQCLFAYLCKVHRYPLATKLTRIDKARSCGKPNCKAHHISENAQYNIFEKINIDKYVPISTKMATNVTQKHVATYIQEAKNIHDIVTGISAKANSILQHVID